MRFIAVLVPLLMTTVLSSCHAPTGTTQNPEFFATYKKSYLPLDVIRTRANLTVISKEDIAFSYKKISECHYDGQVKFPGADDARYDATLSISSVNDRLVLTLKYQDRTSTYIMNKYGHIYSFNSSNAEDKTVRSLPDNKKEVANKIIDNKKRQISHNDVHVIAETSTFFPEYPDSKLKYNQEFSNIVDENDTTWGSLVYHGMIVHDGRIAALIDIQRQVNNENYLSGYSIIDPANGLPFLFEFSAGMRIRAVRKSCVE